MICKKRESFQIRFIDLSWFVYHGNSFDSDTLICHDSWAERRFRIQTYWSVVMCEQKVFSMEICRMDCILCSSLMNNRELVWRCLKCWTGAQLLRAAHCGRETGMISTKVVCFLCLLRDIFEDGQILHFNLTVYGQQMWPHAFCRTFLVWEWNWVPSDTPLFIFLVKVHLTEHDGGSEEHIAVPFSICCVRNLTILQIAGSLLHKPALGMPCGRSAPWKVWKQQSGTG